ncbi:MAG: fasciclin domain-containing protein [Rhizonema sp. PD38]|nr:fasciclin domain-containing protein [Rhizonema sp. PD38]
MHKQNYLISKNWLTKLACFVGIAGVTTLISVPVLAKFFPRYALFQPSAYSKYPYRTSNNDIASTLSGDSKFANLAEELKQARLMETLKKPEKFTIFAPTNTAFNALPKDKFKRYSESNNRLRVLKYHMVAGGVTKEDVDRGTVATIEGTPVRITVDQDIVKLNDAIAKHPSIVTKNGVIIEIDKVLLPSGF